MPSVYYDLEISSDGILRATEATGPTAHKPTAQAAALLTRLQGAFDRARVHIPEGAARNAFLQHILNVGRIGLQDGNVPVANDELARLEENEHQRGHAQFYAVSLDREGRLHLSPAPWAPNPMPEDVSSFVARVDKAINKVRRLIQGTEKRDHYLEMLASYAQRALEQGDIKSATAVLDQFENQFVEEEGPAVRAKYVTSTLWTALYLLAGIALVFIVQTTITKLWPDTVSGQWQRWSDITSAAVAVAFGICVGISFFAFAKNLTLTFDQLGNFDPASLSPVLRFSLVAIIAFILCLLLSAELVNVEIGTSVNFKNYLTEPITAIILGVVCGYSDAAITRTLTGVLDRK